MAAQDLYGWYCPGYDVVDPIGVSLVDSLNIRLAADLGLTQERFYGNTTRYAETFYSASSGLCLPITEEAFDLLTAEEQGLVVAIASMPEQPTRDYDFAGKETTSACVDMWFGVTTLRFSESVDTFSDCLILKDGSPLTLSDEQVLSSEEGETLISESGDIWLSESGETKQAEAYHS